MPTVIHFPDLLPDQDRNPSLPGARHLDPGLGLEPAEDYYLSPSLPMDAKTAGRALKRFEAMSREFSDPRELAALKLGELLPENKEGLLDIKSQLADLDNPEPARERERRDNLVRAQTLLLLAYNLQERSREMGSLEKGLSDTWSRFGDSLGLEEGEDASGLGTAQGPLGAVAAPDSEQGFAAWRGLVRAMAAFLPEDAFLLVDAAPIVEAWRERGVLADASADPDDYWPDGAPEGWTTARATLAQLAGLERTPAKEPWLDRRCGLLVPLAEKGE